MKLIISFGVLFSLLCITTEHQEHLDLANILAKDTALLPSQGMKKGSSATVSCTCNGTTLQEDFPVDALKADQEDINFFEYCEKNATSVCNFSRKCDNCTLDIKNCLRESHKGKISSACFYKSIKIQRGHQMLKTKITGPSRNRRDLYLTGDCVFPSELKTAELKCYVHYKYIKCRQSCLYGYTLEEGISREMKCYYKDKKWNGAGFKECVPFVDCTLKLTSGGKMSCQKNTVWTAPHCDVSCYEYEDKPATPMKKYTCTLEPNKWSPDLPHCVSPGSGFELAPAPRIKDHSKEVFVPEAKDKKSHSVKVSKPIIKRESDAME